MSSYAPQLSFSNSKWTKCLIGNIADVGSSKRIHESEWTTEGIPFVRARDIVSAATNNKNLSPEIFISKETYLQTDKKSSIKKGDVLITGVGTIGVPYLVKHDDLFYYKDGNVLKIRCNELVSADFLYYYLSSNIFQKHLKSIAATGTVATFTINNAISSPIKFPEIKEQQKIAEFFTALDKKIRLNAIKLSHIRSLKSNVARTVLFQHKGIQLNSWVEVHLSDVAEFIKTRDTFDSCIYVGTEHLNKDFGGLCKEVKDTASGVVFKENDILLSNIRPYLKKLWLSDCKGVCSADVLVIRSKSTILPSLLKHILSTDVFFDYVAKGYKGSKMPRGDKDHIELFEFMIPSDLEVQRKIADQLDLFEMMIFCLINKDKHLELLKKAFMQRMFV